MNCPICGQPNHCGVATSSINESGSACWCFHVSIPDGLIALVPPHLRGKSCICRSCVDAYHESDKESSALERCGLKNDCSTSAADNGLLK
ncbi:cysteine-rich CWC family protein [Paenibacillus harenae]|uniref:cysteine-rich CWC family protein n=1 Tax=Paenibacillus harenae TaxID=306543 RepID=UPI0027D80D1A|nr:cysteine-rich CWC family protein [Paenibacillus harenae]